jgi:arginyl-tRNA--protein-N-Asp/Glu arginylyltransferase
LELARQKDESKIRLAEINAIRQVAVAQAKNQPKVYVKYNIYGW